MVNELYVVKFGGSCLSSPQTIVTAAKKIVDAQKQGKQIVVVVSALSGTTDWLLKTAVESTGNRITKQDLDEILSLGERTSVPLMASALKALGLDVVAIDPRSDLWPIFTDANHGNATADLNVTKTAMEEKILPILKRGATLVFPGFIGVSPEGRITTLGRGGSDITAVLLGNLLHAMEVIFVKDVGGVLSADPKKVKDTKRIDELNADETFHLTSAGAKILHPRALLYKLKDLPLRVVGFDEPTLTGGTVIKGTIQGELEATLDETKVSMIALVGEELNSPSATVDILSEAIKTASQVLGMTSTPSSLLLYVTQASNLLERMHELIRTKGIGKAVQCFEPLAMIVVSGSELERIPGVIDMVVSPLAREKVNVYGILTVSSSVRVFVPWDSREKSLKMIQDNLTFHKNNRSHD